MLHSPLATSCVHTSEPVDGRGRRVAVPRAFAWPHFLYLSFSLALLQCSVFIFALSPFGSFLCLLLTLLLHGFIPTLAALCFSFCCSVRAERSCALKAQEQRHLIR